MIIPLSSDCYLSVLPWPQTHEAVAKALEEDPSVFEYDSLYDDMTERKKHADPRLQKRDTKVSVPREASLSSGSCAGSFLEVK